MPTKNGFDLDTPLLQFSPKDPWRIRDACEGTQVFGATGSGKTSGSGKSICKAFLRAGFGGLVLTAKPDERAMWEEYAAECNRTESLIIFGPGQPWRFNFLDYELRRPGAGEGLTENLVHLFSTITELAGTGGSGGVEGGDFWQNAMKQMLRNAIDLVVAAKGQISLPEINAVIASGPGSPKQLYDKAWQANSFCWKCVAEGEAKQKTRMQQLDFETSARYWFSQFPDLGEKTRSSIVMTFTSVADALVRGHIRELFCTTTNLVPELTHNGAIIILDLPIKEYHEVGRYAQVLFKYIWQRATERRDAKANPRPVFLFCDESQLFITSHDAMFQTTARSSRACTVYLTQNLPNYYGQLGGESGKSVTNSLMGNLQTKIFHANGESDTNQWASELFAKTWQRRMTAGGTFTSPDGKGSGSRHMTASLTESLEYEVLAHEFTRLRKGGPENDLCVDGIIFQGGRIWELTGKNYLRVAFSQNA